MQKGELCNMRHWINTYAKAYSYFHMIVEAGFLNVEHFIHALFYII
jgi:hypothetical protein